MRKNSVLQHLVMEDIKEKEEDDDDDDESEDGSVIEDQKRKSQNKIVEEDDPLEEENSQRDLIGRELTSSRRGIKNISKLGQHFRSEES
jgi:hypothetical protein